MVGAIGASRVIAHQINNCWLPALVHGLIGDYQLVHDTVSTDTQKQMEKQNDTVQNTRKQNCSGFIYRF